MSAWEEAFDEASQRSYFFNRITGETSWTPPGEATSENESSSSSHGWQQAFDEASQTLYYYNVHTGETSWTLPEVEYEEDLSYLVFAVVRLQSLFRGKRERRRTMRLVKARYQVTKDPVTDQTLYTNLISSTSSRTKPVLFTALGIGNGEEDDDDEDANFDDFYLEAEQGDGGEGDDDPDNNDDDEDDDAEGSGNKKSRRKYPRSKAQERVDEVEDADKEGVELNLSELNAWKLSSRIWNLQHLKKLVLSKNQLARIPSGIQDLVHLEELDVSYNHLTRLPSCLQTTTTLTALNASHNRLQSFSPKLWKLRAMRRLDLSHNMLQELPYIEGDLKLLRETREWQVGVGLLTELRSLMLNHNKLAQLPKSIEKCTSLEFLNLSNNRVQELGDKVGELESLRCLYLQKNVLTALPESIGSLSRLEILEVKENQLVNVPESTGKLQDLQQLGLSSNQLKHLPAEIGALSHLSRLDLDNNPNLTTFDVLFRRLPSIRSFSANACGIVRFETIEFLKESPVRSLHLRHNALSEFPVVFSSSVMKDTLEELVLRGNNLTRFPLEVVRFCHEIRHLDVSVNKLRRLPPEIGQLFNLEVLYLSENELELLPDELTSLSKLQDFKCDRNRLSKLPLGIGKLTQLTHVNVSFNELETLPTSMILLTALESLYANDNKLKVHPPALYHFSSCFCDYSNNPFNEGNSQVLERRHLVAKAMKLMSEKLYEAAEVLFSSALDTIATQPHEEQKQQRPQLYFTRGVCRFMLLKDFRNEIDNASMVVNDCERELHGKKLLHTRWAINQQELKEKEEKRQRQRKLDQANNNDSSGGGRGDRKETEGREAQSISGPQVSKSSSPQTPSGPKSDDGTGMSSYLEAAAAKRQLARERQHEYARAALADFQGAIKLGVAELPTAHYLEGLTHMALIYFGEAIASFTEALKLIIPQSRDSVQHDNNFAYRDHANYLLSEPVPKIAIHIFLKRAEAYRLLGQLPSALADVRHVLKYHPIENFVPALQTGVEDAERAYAQEWEIQQTEYFVDHVTLFRAFDVAGRSGLARRPEVADLHCCRSSQEAKKARSEAEKAGNNVASKQQQQLRPNERFATEIEQIKAKLHDKRVSERAAIADKFEAKQKLLARTRDFKREIRENLQLEMEEAQQRAVEKELARLAELKRLELEKEFNERLYMKYEDELMHWLVSEEQRLETERLRLLEEAQRKADAKAAYATRLARRGGRRQQVASQRGTGGGTGAGRASGNSSRAQSRNTASSSSSSSSAVSTPATRRTPAPSSPSRE